MTTDDASSSAAACLGRSMTAAESRVLTILEAHRDCRSLFLFFPDGGGPVPAPPGAPYVRIDDLAALTSLHWREVQAAVTSLIIVHGFKIGHSTSPRSPGNRLLGTQAEIDDEADRLRARALKILVRVKALKDLDAAAMARQVEMELNGADKEGAMS
ncbi:MAG: hypothetical protein RX318_03830 [bacterium]|nr:hypothetical protein [bacterium]